LILNYVDNFDPEKFIIKTSPQPSP
jgi:hypothetical protein